MGASGRRILKISAVAATLVITAIAAVALYTAIDPESSVFFPKCPFHMLTGLECPGCGSQRAIHSLLNGDIAAAIHYNLLIVLSIPYLLLLAILEIAKRIILSTKPLDRTKTKLLTTISRIIGFLYHGKAILTVIAIILLFWIFRNFSAAF